MPTAKIVLLGATGYTGARTAEAMVRRGLTPVLAGRDPDRLGLLAQRFGGLRTARVDVTDPASLGGLLLAGDVLVSTVGPFVELGEPAVLAAVEAGAIYLDSTGEPPFIRRIFTEHGPQAERSGATLLTAFGNDFVPGNLAGGLVMREAGERTARVEIGYFITGGGIGQPFSRGTLDSMIGVLAEPGFAWRDGYLRTEPAAAQLRTFEVDGRTRPGVSIGSSEHFGLPRFAATGIAPELRTVGVYLGWFGPASYPVHYGARLASLAGPLLTPLAKLLAAHVGAEPSAATLAASTSHFMAEAFDDTGALLATVHLTSPDGYAITADLLAWGAGRAIEHGVTGAGALDPITAFGLDTLRDGAADAGIVPVG